MIERVTIQQIADALGMQKRPAGTRAKRGNWPYIEEATKGGYQHLYEVAKLPADVQAAVCRAFTENRAPSVSYIAYDETVVPFEYDRAALWSNFEGKPESMKAKARKRLAAIHTALQLIVNGIPRTKAWNTAATTAGFDRASLYRWYQDVVKYDEADWLAALVPKYVGRTVTADCSDEAWEFFKADYLRLEQPAYAACYERLKRASTEHGWTVPSLKTLQRRMERDVPLTVRVLRREGEHALMRLYPAQQRSVAELHALQWINADGYQHNVFVKWPDGTIARPKTWVFQDIYSRKVLSWRTDQTEHTDVIRLSFGDLVEKYGIPEHVTIDNTRAAANKWMTGGVPNRYRFKVKDDDPMGLFPVLGVQVHWTTVLNGKGHGQAKPIERTFGVGGFGEYIDKHPAFAGAFTGNSPMAKPENYGSKAIPLETFLQVLEQEVHAWNAREGRRTEMADGRSFDQTFNDSYSQSTIRKATAEQRRLWLLTAEAVTVRKDATVLLDAGSASGYGKNRYYAERLYEVIGKKVIVRFDPDRLHEAVHFYTLDGRYIAAGSCIDATGFGDTAAAREHSRARKAMTKATKEAARAELTMDALAVAARLPGTEVPSVPDAGAVRLMTLPSYTARQPERTETEEDRRAMEQLKAEMAQTGKLATLRPSQLTPEQKYAWAYQLEQKIAQGEYVSPEERTKLTGYQETAEYRAQRDFHNDFGLTPTLCEA